MYSYNNHTTPSWSCINQTPSMPLQFQPISNSPSVLTNWTPPYDSWLFWTNKHPGTRYLSMSAFLFTPLLATEKLSGSNVLKVIPIQVIKIQCLSHIRRPAKGTRDYLDSSWLYSNSCIWGFLLFSSIFAFQLLSCDFDCVPITQMKEVVLW